MSNACCLDDLGNALGRMRVSRLVLVVLILFFLISFLEQHETLQGWLKASMSLFSHKYTAASAKRYKCWLYFFVSLLTTPVFPASVLTEEQIQRLDQILDHVDLPYAQISESECQENVYQLQY